MGVTSETAKEFLDQNKYQINNWLMTQGVNTTKIFELIARVNATEGHLFNQVQRFTKDGPLLESKTWSFISTIYDG